MTEPREPRARGKIWSSISFKLTAAFAFVSIMGIVLVAFFIRQSAQGEFVHYVKARTDTDFGSRLADYYTAHQGWTGVGEVFTAPAQPQAQRPHVLFTVVDSNHDVVYGTSSTYTVGTPVARDALEEAMPIKSSGQVVGWLIVDTPPPIARDGYSPESDYINRMTNAVVTAALIAMVVAVVIGASLARTLSHPIQELTEATRRVARGALGYQVTVRTRDELGALAESFNQMSKDLAQATDLRRQMTADIAHELRSPLSVILGYTEALSEAKLPGSADIFQSLHVEARHLQRLIDDLRLLSLADAGELPLALQPAAPKLLLEQVRMSYASQAARHHITLSADAPDDLPDIYVDPDRLAQVLGNLVNNALRYTPAKGEVILSATRHGSQVELRVRDTGAGISQENLRHIFDRFYRGDEARFSETGESGLGLAIAKSIVEAHRGTVAVESVEGKGSTFILRLPVVEA
jgi:two-component system sensor histidine kinase BaeS